jgi:hypothetical protein
MGNNKAQSPERAPSSQRWATPIEWETTKHTALKGRKLTTMGNAHRMENNKAQSPERAKAHNDGQRPSNGKQQGTKP